MNPEHNMSQNTAMGPIHPVSPQRDDSASRHRSAVTREMHPIGFGMRADLFCRDAIIAAIDLADGLAFTLKRVENAFFGQWGWEHAEYEARKMAADSELQCLMAEHMRLRAELEKLPATVVLNRVTLPSGPALAGWWCLVAAIACLTVLGVLNAASYFRFEAQGWAIALLMASPLLFVAVPPKYVGRKLTETGRKRFGFALAFVFLAAFATYMYTLAARANPPSTADVLDGTTRSVACLIPLQLAAQTLLDIITVTVFWHWQMDLLAAKSTVVINPDIQPLTRRLETLNTSMAPVRSRLADAQGNLDEMEASLRHWLAQAEAIFLVNRECEQRLQERRKALNTAPNL